LQQAICLLDMTHGCDCKNLISTEIYWTTTHWPWLKGNWNGSKCCAAWHHERWCDWRVMQVVSKIMSLYIGSASEIVLMMNNIYCTRIIHIRISFRIVICMFYKQETQYRGCTVSE